MAVTEQVPEIEFVANGATSTFPFNFKVPKVDDLLVAWDGLERDDGFSVSGLGNSGGGNVVFAPAPASGVVVTIQRSTRLLRQTDYQQSGDFLSPVVNADFDRAIFALQEIAAEAKRGIRVAVGESGLTLPPAAPNRVLGTNGFGVLGFQPIASAVGSLGYTPVNKAGDTVTGPLTINGLLTVNGVTDRNNTENVRSGIHNYFGGTAVVYNAGSLVEYTSGATAVYDAGSTTTFATGAVVRAPTPPTADTSTLVATTAFVKAQGYATTGSGLSSVATMAALRANTVSALTQVFVRGYATPTDGGEGMFVYAPGDTTSPDNGGTLIVDTMNRRWYRAYGKGALNICWFGSVRNTPNDCSPAFNAALAVGNNILFPEGTFTFTSPISYTYPNNKAALTITGAGAKVTVLNWPSAASGITTTCAGPLNSLHVRDLVLSTGMNGTTGAAFTVNQPFPLGDRNAFEQSDFTNVSIRGADGPDANNYWGTCVQLNNASAYTFINVKMDGQHIDSYTNVGKGVVVTGTEAIIPCGFNFTCCNFNYLGIGFIYGPWVQGVTFVQSGFTGCSVGIEAPSEGAGTVLSQLTMHSTQFNCYAYGIRTTAPIGGVTITGGYFFVLMPGGTGIFMPVSQGFSITNTIFQGPGGANGNSAIVVSGNPVPLAGVITGNLFFGFNVAVTIATSYINVQSNAYTGNTTNTVDLGSNNKIGGGSA